MRRIGSQKTGLSNLVAYVLLIAITIFLSILVYGWLKFYAEWEDVVECPSNVNVIIESYECVGGAGGNLTVNLRNKGLFDIDGFVLRVHDRVGAEFGLYVFDANGGKINLGDNYAVAYKFSDYVDKMIEDITIVDVQPYINESDGKVACDVYASQRVVCDGGVTSCANIPTTLNFFKVNEDYRDDFDASHNAFNYNGQSCYWKVYFDDPCGGAKNYDIIDDSLNLLMSIDGATDCAGGYCVGWIDECSSGYDGLLKTAYVVDSGKTDVSGAVSDNFTNFCIPSGNGNDGWDNDCDGVFDEDGCQLCDECNLCEYEECSIQNVGIGPWDASETVKNFFDNPDCIMGAVSNVPTCQDLSSKEVCETCVSDCYAGGCRNIDSSSSWKCTGLFMGCYLDRSDPQLWDASLTFNSSYINPDCRAGPAFQEPTCHGLATEEICETCGSNNYDGICYNIDSSSSWKYSGLFMGCIPDHYESQEVCGDVTEKSCVECGLNYTYDCGCYNY